MTARYFRVQITAFFDCENRAVMMKIIRNAQIIKVR